MWSVLMGIDWLSIRFSIIIFYYNHNFHNLFQRLPICRCKAQLHLQLLADLYECFDQINQMEQTDIKNVGQPHRLAIQRACLCFSLSVPQGACELFQPQVESPDAHQQGKHSLYDFRLGRGQTDPRSSCWHRNLRQHAEYKRKYVQLIEIKFVLFLAHEFFGLLPFLLIFDLPFQIFEVLLLVGGLSTLVEHAAQSAISELLWVHSFFLRFDFIFDTHLLVEDFAHLQVQVLFVHIIFMKSAKLLGLFALGSFLDLKSLEFALFFFRFLSDLLVVIVNLWILTICATMKIFVPRVESSELIVQIGAVISMFLTLHLQLLLLLFLYLAIQLINHAPSLLLHSHHSFSLRLHANIKRWSGCWALSEFAFNYVSEKHSILLLHLSPLFNLFSASPFLFLFGFPYLPLGYYRVILVFMLESHFLAVAFADLFIKLLPALRQKDLSCLRFYSQSRCSQILAFSSSSDLCWLMSDHSSARWTGLGLQASSLLRQSIINFIIRWHNRDPQGRLHLLDKHNPSKNHIWIQAEMRVLKCGVCQQKNTNLIMKRHKFLNNIFCNNHSEERLNLVCLNKACPNRGLICQLCRSDEGELHYRHLDDLVPFKYLLESLEANLDDKQTEFSPVNENYCLSRLQKLRDEMLARLSATVQELARLVGELQIRIINEFEEQKDQMRQKGLVFRQYKNCIDRCIIHNIRKEQKFQLMAEIRKIVEHVKPYEGKSGYKYHLDLTGKFIIADFVEKNEKMRLDCERLEIDFKSIFGNNREKQTVPILQKYQEELMKKELNSIKAENKKAIQAKKKAQELKMSKAQEEKLQKKKEQKDKKKQKKKQEQEKKSKKEKEANPVDIKYEKQSLLQKMNVILPTPLKSAVLEFIPAQLIQEDMSSSKKKYKVSFSQFAETEMKIENSIKSNSSNSSIFSSLFKGISVKITKSGRVAKQTTSEDKISGFAVVSQALDKCKKIALKIIKIKGEIYVGVARHEIIAANKYAFNMNTEGHGSYLINSKGTSFSSGYPQENKQQTVFAFDEGDIVNLVYQEGVIFFERVPGKKSNSMPQQATLNLQLQAGDTKAYNFCVFLAGSGDSVQLI